MPALAKNQCDAPRWADQRGCSDSREPARPWDRQSKGTRGTCEQSGEPVPALPPGPPPCWAPDARAVLTDSLRKQTGHLTQPAMPTADVTKPGEFSPPTAQPGSADTGSVSRDHSRGKPGQGSGHGSNAGCCTLSAQPWPGPAGGAALAGLGGSAAGRVAPGLGCCGSRIPAARAGFPCSLISPSTPRARLQLQPFSPGWQTARGGHAPTLGAGYHCPGHPAGARDGRGCPALPWEGKDHAGRAISKQSGHLQTGL